MPVFIDQIGQAISLKKTPQRIISLVPSQTELLYDLGLRDEVTGITKFCIHPDEWFRNKTRVGGTKQLKTELIKQLQPDLIIANKEENIKEQVEELQKHFPVWISDINNLDDAYEMIEQIGLITGKQETAKNIVSKIKEGFAQLQTTKYKLQTVYLIWQKPYMTVGGDTFIHCMLESAGVHNLFAIEKRYPETNINELVSLKPDILLLSSEPFPFKQEHIEELQALLPGTKILLVDGEMFSWYGSRLLKAPAYFRTLQEQIK
jgi:ABC-type Fe3+-hydroxamate transport system substrate-binding protein